MRVLVTHERFLPDYSGGCEYGVYHLARGLREHGVGVSVLTTGDPRKSEYDGLATRRLPVHRYRMNLAVKDVVECARDADLIQTSNYHASLPAMMAGRRLRKPVVLLVTALCGRAWLDTRGVVLGRAYVWWERFLMHQPFSRIVFPSEHSRQAGLRMGIAASRCVVIHPGFEQHLFKPALQKEDTVLFVGKFERRKGVHEVLEVARRLPHVPFRLLGWGPEIEAIRQAASPNVSIEFLPPGAIMDETRASVLASAFGRASIFFLPSKAESFGLVLVEAMASGCAVVSTVPLNYEGAHVAEGDVPQMTAAIRRLSDDPDTTAELGRRNVALAREYNWDTFSRALIEIYRNVLGEMNRC
jgi:glycosyltransferase involved in cell wall biosynthesis